MMYMYMYDVCFYMHMPFMNFADQARILSRNQRHARYIDKSIFDYNIHTLRYSSYFQINKCVSKPLFHRHLRGGSSRKVVALRNEWRVWQYVNIYKLKLHTTYRSIRVYFWRQSRGSSRYTYIRAAVSGKLAVLDQNFDRRINRPILHVGPRFMNRHNSFPRACCLLVHGSSAVSLFSVRSGSLS
jgi:hypothetical protein